ncbi:MAG: hypothetical protein M9921_05200 [Fimbriimonadaceae bacterium]|nr:hypothetical protein [Chthonomonadaceae bacterium]MCO5296236.1 hypothetical protein [Fimbriimonadaceae bacterium]
MRLLQILAIGLAVAASGQTPTPPAATTYKGHDALDHWVGEWDVFMGGQKVGSSVIEKTLKGFGVTEHWTSARGGQGRSFFVFDAADGTWRQLWISDTGWIVQKTGKPIQGGISLEGESKYPSGKKTKSREKLTKNADGSVRQLIEDYDEATKKWTVAFDGKYVRKGDR